MLNFKNRFHGHGSLNYVYRHGDIVRSKIITIKFLTNKYRRFSRVSVVISKKIEKTAVGRNQIRRRVYEIIRPLLTDFSSIIDLVIIINSVEINDLEHGELKNKLVDILKEAKILYNK